MLTVKQDNFCNIYVETGNASHAYRQAYCCDKMKHETVNRNANKLLNNNNIITRVKELQSQLQQRSDINKDEAVKILTDLVRLNPLDYVELSNKVKTLIKEGGEEISTEQILIIKDLNNLPKDKQRCIKSISPTKFGLKIEFESKISAIDRLAKMLDWDSAIKTKIQDGSIDVEEWINSKIRT